MNPQTKKSGVALLMLGALFVVAGAPMLYLSVSSRSTPRTEELLVPSIFLVFAAAFIIVGWRTYRTSKTMCPLQSLTPADFSGIDPERFRAWLDAEREAGQTGVLLRCIPLAAIGLRLLFGLFSPRAALLGYGLALLVMVGSICFDRGLVHPTATPGGSPTRFGWH